MLNIIILSMDRACQLELLLRSFRASWHGDMPLKINVLYKCSNSEFRQGYEKLFNLYTANYVEQKNFKEDLLSLINNPYATHTMFFVDDLVFIRMVPGFTTKYFDNESIASFSLRLGTNINFNYSTQRHIKQPHFEFDNELYKEWNWRKLSAEYRDWMYPMSLDGNVFRTEDLQRYFKLDFENPNTFEGMMAKRPLRSRPMLICYPESKVVNLAVNRVQSTYKNKCGNVSANSLNRHWLSGKRINLQPILDHKFNACHSEFKFDFEIFNY